MRNFDLRDKKGQGWKENLCVCAKCTHVVSVCRTRHEHHSLVLAWMGISCEGLLHPDDILLFLIPAIDPKSLTRNPKPLKHWQSQGLAGWLYLILSVANTDLKSSYLGSYYPTLCKDSYIAYKVSMMCKYRIQLQTKAQGAIPHMHMTLCLYFSIFPSLL